MPNNLAKMPRGMPSMPGAVVNAAPLANQGPQVDTQAMQTPPDPNQPTPDQGPGPGGPTSREHIFQMAHAAAVTNGVFNHLRKMGNMISRDDVVTGAVKLVAQRVMSAQQMAKYLADLPADPQDIREWVAKHASAVSHNLAGLMMAIHGVSLPENKLQQQPQGVPQQPQGTAPQAPPQPPMPVRMPPPNRLVPGGARPTLQ